jgi:hypothetical protein
MFKHITARSSLRAGATILTGLLFEFAFLALPANAADQGKQATSDVTLTTERGGPVAPATPPLHLSDAQRTRIAGVLKKQDTETEFKLKKAKSAKSFEPKIDEKLPKGLRSSVSTAPAHRNYANPPVHLPQTQRAGAHRQSDDQQDRRHVSRAGRLTSILAAS